MTPVEFVNAIRALVMDAAVLNALSAIQHPPGRNPDEALISVHVWFERLSDRERDWVLTAMAMVARNAVGGLLAVLDGSQCQGLDSSSGYLELRYVQDGVIHILAGPHSTQPLRELL